MPKLDNLTDAELIDLCNHGSSARAAEAFSVLYHRHKDFVLRVAYRLLGDADLALDVLQETFIYLMKKFPPSGNGLQLHARLTTLLYPVAKNLSLNMLRKESRFTASTDAQIDELLPNANSEHDIDARDVGGLLQGLSAQHQEVVQLRFVHDLSLAEIAEALDIPVGTVKSRLHLAVKILREAPATKIFFNP